MTASTHFVFSAFLCSMFTKNISFMLIPSVFALLPDIDHPSSLIGRIFFFISEPINKRFGHRTVTHSFFAVVVFAVVMLPVVFYNSLFYALSVLAFASHSIADMFNTTGVRFFYPVSDKEFVAYRSEKFRLPVRSWKEMVLLVVLVFFMASVYQKSFSISSVIRHVTSGIYKSYDTAYVDFKESADRVCYADIEYYDLITRSTIETKYLILNMDATSIILLTDQKQRLLINKQDVKNIKIKPSDDKFKVLTLQSNKIEDLEKVGPENFITGTLTLYNYGLNLVPSKHFFYDKNLSDSFVTLNFARLSDLTDLLSVIKGVPGELEVLKLKLSENKLDTLQSKRFSLEHQIKKLKVNFYKNYERIKVLSDQLNQVQNKINLIQSGVSAVDEVKLAEDIKKLSDFRLSYNLFVYSLPVSNFTFLSTQ